MGFGLADRSENATILFPNFPASEDFERFALVWKVLFGFCTVFYAGIVAILVIRFREAWKDLRWRRKWVLAYLSGNVAFSILVLIWEAILMSPGRYNAHVCSYLGGMGGMLYCFASTFCYLVLLERAVSTNDGLGDRRVNHKRLLLLIKISTYLAPVIGIVSIAVFKGTLVFEERFCLMDLVPEISWTFLMLDTVLSLGYIIAFIIPVLGHISLVERSSLDVQDFKVLAVRNLQYSLLAIASTFTFLYTVSVLAEKLKENQTPDNQHLRLVVFCGNLDLLINTFVIFQVTRGVWKPKFMRSSGGSSRTTQRNAIISSRLTNVSL